MVKPPKDFRESLVYILLGVNGLWEFSHPTTRAICRLVLTWFFLRWVGLKPEEISDLIRKFLNQP